MDGYREARARSFQGRAAKGKGQLTQDAAKEMWLDVRKKNHHECDQAQEQVVQNKKKPLMLIQVLNTSFTQQMSPSVEHIFWCLTGQPVFGVSAWDTHLV